MYAGCKHFAASILVALVCAAVVFSLWFPYPYSHIAGGLTLFSILISVDITCGPLLTVVVFSPSKPRGEMRRDIAIIVGLQLSALLYGLYSVYQARPVFLAFEGDRFRVVSAADVDQQALLQAPEALRQLPMDGPHLIGVRLAKGTDKEFLQSVQLSMEGIHPAFRPGRWTPYAEQREAILKEAAPISRLKSKHPPAANTIEALLNTAGLPADQAGYIPLLGRESTNWVVVVDKRTARPAGFLPLDGW